MQEVSFQRKYVIRHMNNNYEMSVNTECGIEAEACGCVRASPQATAKAPCVASYLRKKMVPVNM